MQRSTRDVLEDHLRRRGKREVEGDITRNYAEDVVLLTGFGVLRGHEGVRRSAQLLREQLPCARYRVVSLDCCQIDVRPGNQAAYGPSAEKSALRESAEKSGIPKAGNSPGTPPDTGTAPSWSR